MLKLAIDLGTSQTKIFRIGSSGIVLAEPTCVAINKENGQIKAVGEEAKLLLGRTAERTSVLFPVIEGEIVDAKSTVALLNEFLKKIGVTGSVRRHSEVLFSVPSGIPEKSVSAIYNVCDELGISRIHFVEAPYLSALGQDLPLGDSSPVFVMDIGGGTTNMGALSLDGVIAGLSVNVGGNNMDAHIVDHIAENFGLRIGLLTAERLKNAIGSLYEGDNQSAVIEGRDIASGRPASVVVGASDILFPIRVYVDKLVEYAGMLLRKLPAEVSATICHGGLHLSGGVARLTGLAEYIGEQLGMRACVADEAQLSVIMGAGRAIGNSFLLKKISLNAEE